MGSCFGKCMSWKKSFRIFNNHRSHVARFRESSSIIEFESLIGENEDSIYPQSVVLPHEKKLVSDGHLHALSDAQFILDKFLLNQFRKKEESLELEENFFLPEEKSEAGSMEIITPSELLVKNNPKSGHSNEHFIADEEDFDAFLERVRAKSLAQKDQHLILNPGALLKNGSSTTHSSLELDWENEGFAYLQETSVANTDEDLLATRTDTTSVRSRQDSNSFSNDLEWDEDIFLDTESPRPNLDNETEMLLDEIEQLTARALDETGPNR